jgi:hypothetical protein
MAKNGRGVRFNVSRHPTRTVTAARNRGVDVESFENTAFYHGVVSPRHSFAERNWDRLFHC